MMIEVSPSVLIALASIMVAIIFWCFRLESRQQKMIETLDRMAAESHEWRRQQQDEHKEMIILLQGIRVSGSPSSRPSRSWSTM